MTAQWSTVTLRPVTLRPGDVDPHLGVETHVAQNRHLVVHDDDDVGLQGPHQVADLLAAVVPLVDRHEIPNPLGEIGTEDVPKKVLNQQNHTPNNQIVVQDTLVTKIPAHKGGDNLINRYHLYRQALLTEAERLVQTQVLTRPKNIFYLTVAELHKVARTHQINEALVTRRRDAFRFHRTLTPPRVLTSDGKALTGAYRRDNAPAGALINLPVSAETVKDRARVILDLTRAELDAGDILVTTHTDPS